MSINKIEQATEKIKQMGIIAIVRGNYPIQEIVEIGDALLAAPVLIMEVTLNSAGALEAIAALRERYGKNMLIGAGTVRTVAQVDAAIDAGAQFIVSPNFDLDSVQRSHQRDTLHLPGVLTPTEIQTAVNAGCSMVKIFPSDCFGPNYIKALKAPLDDVDFVPTGGIGVDNIGDYARVGVAAVGVGSSLIPKRDWSNAEIITKARAMRANWEDGVRNR